MTTQDLFRGEHTLLTAFSADDLSDLARWQEDSEFLRLFDARPAYPKTEAQLEQWLEDFHKDPNAYLFAIRLVASDEIIGYVELDGIMWAHGNGWLGIGIGDRAYWGRGFGAEAARLAVNYAFHELNLHRLQATVFSYNARSQALFERLGFVREGAYREYVRRDGQWHDMILYGILAKEWRAQVGREAGS